MDWIDRMWQSHKTWPVSRIDQSIAQECNYALSKLWLLGKLYKSHDDFTVDKGI